MPKITRFSDFIHKAIFYGPTGTEADENNTRGDIDTEPDYENPLYTLWCKIEPLTANEFLRAQQIRGDLTHMVSCHYTTLVSHRHVFKWNGRTFCVGPPASPDERGVFTYFYAAEKTG